MKMISLAAVALIVSGCGSVTTLSNNDTTVANKLKRSNTSCDEVFRVYSGVSYDLCKLHSTPNSSYYNLLLGFYVLDLFPSAIVDTVVLPYTIYTQNKHGDIDIK